MAEQDANTSANVNIPWKWVTVVTGVVVAAALNFAFNVSQDATIALQTSNRQGEEILTLRGELAGFREEIKNLTESRYTSIEATRDLVYIERRLSNMEKQIEKHQQVAHPVGGQ